MLGALLHKNNPAAPRQGPEKAAFPAHLAHWDGTYATAYVEDSSADEDDEGYWRGAWSEEPSGAAAAAGGSEGAGAVAPEEQRPAPEVWPCPPTSTARPCAARVAVLGMGGYKGRGVLARRALSWHTAQLLLAAVGLHRRRGRVLAKHLESASRLVPA